MTRNFRTGIHRLCLLSSFVKITVEAINNKSDNAILKDGLTKVFEPNAIITQSDVDNFKDAYNLLKDRDLDLQQISYENTITYNGKVYKLEGKPIDIFTPGATYTHNGSPGDLPIVKTLKQINGDEIVTIMKTSDDDIKNVIISDVKNGWSVELASIAPSVLVAIESDAYDFNGINKKFHYGESRFLDAEWEDKLSSEIDEFGKPSMSVNCTSYKRLNLAVAYESSFCARHNFDQDTADHAAIALVELVSQRYEQVGLCVRVKISHLEGFCDSATDPYKPYIDLNFSGRSGDEGGVLQGIKNYWNSHNSDVIRDVVHLFSGSVFECDSDGCVVGYAFFGTTCNIQEAYGISFVNFTSSYSLVSVVVAHELGHNNGANHYEYGNHIMFRQVNNAINGFSATSIQAFCNSDLGLINSFFVFIEKIVFQFLGFDQPFCSYK